MLSLFGILLVSFLSTLAFTPVAMYAARRLGYLDQPGARKVHVIPTPLMGGAAVFIGFSIAFLLGFFAAGLVDNGVLRGYIIGAALIFAVGLIDDAVGITPGSKLIGQVLAAVLFLTFSGAGAIIMNSPLDITIGLLWMVTLMNALNFLDNMDGLCSGISFSAALGFTILGFSINHPLLAIMGVALMGALIGFMYFNLNPAKIFLGDAGSMFLGYTLAAMGIMFAVSHSSPQDLLVPLLIMSYPLFDISFVTFTRFREGRSVAQPGKDHTSHRLVDLGVRSTRAVWQIFLISCALAILGNILYKGIDAAWKLIVVAAVAFVLLIFGVHLHRRFTNVFQKISLIILDLIGINVTFVLFYLLRFQSGIFEVSLNIAMVEYVPAAIWITFYWLFIFGIFGQYEFEWDRIKRFELVKLLKAVLVGSGIFLLLAFDFTSTFRSLLFHLTFYAMLLFMVIGTLRLLFLFSIRKYYLSYGGKRKTILVGSKESEEWFGQTVVEKGTWGIDIIGRVGCNAENEGALGTIDNLRDLIREHRAAEVLVLEPADDQTRLRDMLGCGHFIDVTYKILPHQVSYFKGFKKERLSHTKLYKVYPERMRAWEWGFKRLTDFVVSIILLAFSFPFLLVAIMASRINIGGKIFIRERCLGINEQEITIPKFRVSKNQTDSKETASYDITPETFWGRFLRISRFERMPMLIPVLLGKMSLVGPEPVLADESMNRASEHPHYDMRFLVKPGLINNYPAQLSTSEETGLSELKLEWDLKYLESMSTLTDFKIMIKSTMRIWTKILSIGAINQCWI